MKAFVIFDTFKNEKISSKGYLTHSAAETAKKNLLKDMSAEEYRNTNYIIKTVEISDNSMIYAPEGSAKYVQA